MTISDLVEKECTNYNREPKTKKFDIKQAAISIKIDGFQNLHLFFFAFKLVSIYFFINSHAKYKTLARVDFL